MPGSGRTRYYAVVCCSPAGVCGRCDMSVCMCVVVGPRSRSRARSFDVVAACGPEKSTMTMGGERRGGAMRMVQIPGTGRG